MTWWVSIGVLVAAVILGTAWTIGVLEGRRRHRVELAEAQRAERRRSRRQTRRELRGRARRAEIRAAVSEESGRPVP